MAKASDNPFPSLLIVEGTEPSAPAAGRQRLYIDSTTHQLKRTDSSGTDVTIEGGGAATDGWNSTSGLSYSAADAPTFLIATSSDLTSVISVGARIKLTQTTVKYFIVTAITSTTITVYGGTDYTLANAAISSPYYSTAKVPYGFPADPAKWTVETTQTTGPFKSSPVASTWYGDTALSPTGPNIVIPIGAWRVSFQCIAHVTRASAGGCGQRTGLSTSASSAPAGTLVTMIQGNSQISSLFPSARETALTLTVKTTYYMVIMTGDSSIQDINIRGDIATTVLRALCAYL